MVRVPYYLPPLDDRKLGLPSDYLLRHHPPPPPPSAAVPHHSHRSSSSSSFSDDFFRHLSLLKQSRRLSQLMPSVPLQPVRPPVRSAHQMQIQGKVPNFDHHHHQQLLSPAQIQVACSAENRKRVLRRKHQDNILASQFRFGSNGGSHEVSGGTGVFHPRVSQFSTSTTSVLEAQRKQGLRSGEETRALQQRNYPMESVGLRKGEYYHHELHSDAGLPQHWTY